MNKPEAPVSLVGKARQLVIRKCSIAGNCKSHIGALDNAGAEGVTKGWTVVSMKSDWRRVFPYE